MQVILNALVPILLVIGVGFVVRKGGWVEDKAFRGMGWMVFWVGLPALLFYKIAEMEELADAAWPMFYVMLGVTMAAVALGYLAAALMRLNRGQTGAFVQAAFRGNLIFVGLPIILAALYALYPDDIDKRNELERIAILSVAPLIALYNLGSVAVLLPSVAVAESRGKFIMKSIRGTVTNPLVIACVAGLIWQMVGPDIPTFAYRTLTTTGAMALPLALVVLGGALGAAKIRGTITISTVSALIKVAACPTLAYAICRAADLPHDSTVIVTLFMATPTAVASHVIAEQMGGDLRVSSNTVVISTILSMASFAVAMLLLIGGG